MQKWKRPQNLIAVTTPKLRLAFTEKAVCPDFNFRRAPIKNSRSTRGACRDQLLLRLSTSGVRDLGQVKKDECDFFASHPDD